MVWRSSASVVADGLLVRAVDRAAETDDGAMMARMMRAPERMLPCVYAMPIMGKRQLVTEEPVGNAGKMLMDPLNATGEVMGGHKLIPLVVQPVVEKMLLPKGS